MAEVYDMAKSFGGPPETWVAHPLRLQRKGWVKLQHKLLDPTHPFAHNAKGWATRLQTQALPSDKIILNARPRLRPRQSASRRRKTPRPQQFRALKARRHNSLGRRPRYAIQIVAEG